MSFDNILEVVINHENAIDAVKEQLDSSKRLMLSESLTLSKRVINNSSQISLISYFDILSQICSNDFDKAYSKFAVDYDVEHEETSLCYVILQKAHPSQNKEKLSRVFDLALHSCFEFKNNEPQLNANEYQKKYVYKWLSLIRPEHKIYLVKAFNNEEIVQSFGLSELEQTDNGLIELTTHTFMACAFLAALNDREDTHNKNTLDQLSKLNPNVALHLSSAINTILAETGLAALHQTDVVDFEKAVKQNNIKIAQSKRKTVSSEAKQEWRDFALNNWSQLPKPNNQVQHMAQLIKDSLESAANFELVTIGDKLNRIKQQALSQK